MAELVDAASLEKKPLIKADPGKALREIEKWVAAMDSRLELTYNENGPHWEIRVILEGDEITEFTILADVARAEAAGGINQTHSFSRPVRYTQKQVTSAVRVGLERLITKRKNIRLFLGRDRKGNREVVQADNCESLTENGLQKDFP